MGSLAPISMLLSKLAPCLIAPAALAGAGVFIYGTIFEPRNYRLEVERVTIGGGIESSGGNGKKRPLRILHLSDLHLCYPESHKIEFLQKITGEVYDLVVLTGDIFENYSGLAYASSILSSAPRLGAYAVLGNHDYFNYTLFHKTLGKMMRKFRHPREKRDVRPMIAALERGGFQTLQNEAVNLAENNLHIVGIDYPTIARSQLDALVSNSLPGQLRLVLFHVPCNLENISRAGAHMVFGGHTHGGQIRLPILGAVVTDSELPPNQASGIFWRGATAFHISRGLGADPRTNIRLLCPPAATVIELSFNHS